MKLKWIYWIEMRLMIDWLISDYYNSTVIRAGIYLLSVIMTIGVWTAIITETNAAWLIHFFHSVPFWRENWIPRKNELIQAAALSFALVWSCWLVGWLDLMLQFSNSVEFYFIAGNEIKWNFILNGALNNQPTTTNQLQLIT